VKGGAAAVNRITKLNLFILEEEEYFSTGFCNAIELRNLVWNVFSVILQLQNLFDQIKVVTYFKVLTPFSFEEL